MKTFLKRLFGGTKKTPSKSVYEPKVCGYLDEHKGFHLDVGNRDFANVKIREEEARKVLRSCAYKLYIEYLRLYIPKENAPQDYMVAFVDTPSFDKLLNAYIQYIKDTKQACDE